MTRRLNVGLLLLMPGCNPLSTPQGAADGLASVSSPVAVTSNGNTLWVVDPDADRPNPMPPGAVRMSP